MRLNKVSTNPTVYTLKVHPAALAYQATIRLQGKQLCLSNKFRISLSQEVQRLLHLSLWKTITRTGFVWVK
jgi:hypothetical protein